MKRSKTISCLVLTVLVAACTPHGRLPECHGTPTPINARNALDGH